MTIAALVLAALALLMVLPLRKRLAALETWVDDQRRNANIGKADTEELKESVDGLRKLVALMAAGRTVDAEMVKENRLYQNARPDEVQSELEAGGTPYVIDVRSPQEWAAGHIECAVHIPVDDISKRMSEIARDGRKMYMICAAGGRSAAAASFLANRGYLNVHSVEGGMGAWRGKVVKT
ncbi:MAG: rhodanese-like domain-containing protein [Planctomycetota bacterium]|jgi:rhodanese-related sulfurtransferase